MSHPLLANLPQYLDERVRVQAEGSKSTGQFVLYWMRSAIRTDENPALDVAISIADRLQLPLLVYQALSQHYEYASDRHHTFILEGARDVQWKFSELGISYAFHLATPEDSKSHLLTLAQRSKLVVTEDMPVDPPRRFLEALVASCKTPVVCVDTACIVPMQLLKKPYTRAFQFRDATKSLYAERLTRQWPTLNLMAIPFAMSALPFEPVDLQAAELSEMVARCEIDHSIGPVVDTHGGSLAGYDRWNQFRRSGLGGYANRRNNPLLDGVSRMSAYLHYGMVSPFRIAREAAEVHSAGSEKYLDELLIWRELAYGFCFYRDDHDQWTALPDWRKRHWKLTQTTFTSIFTAGKNWPGAKRTMPFGMRLSCPCSGRANCITTCA